MKQYVGFEDLVVSLNTARITKLKMANLGTPCRGERMTKDLVIQEVKPYGAMVTQEIIKVKVTSLDNSEIVGSPDTVNRNIALITGVSGRGCSWVVFAKHQMT